MITIRNYDKKDAPVAWKLKYDTIRTINIEDYSLELVKIWAPDHIDRESWQNRIDEMNPFIAEIDDQIVGFADLQKDGYIDHFFCHSDYQRVGVGRALMEHLFMKGETAGIRRYYSHVSITARPFFEKFGFDVVDEQHTEINGLVLTNFIMEKIIR